MNGLQNQLVLVHTAALEYEGAINMTIRSNNKTHANLQIVVFDRQQRVGSQEGLWGMDLSALWEGEGSAYRRKF
jgi:hypothetical protein